MQEQREVLIRITTRDPTRSDPTRYWSSQFSVHEICVFDLPKS